MYQYLFVNSVSLFQGTIWLFRGERKEYGWSMCWRILTRSLHTFISHLHFYLLSCNIKAVDGFIFRQILHDEQTWNKFCLYFFGFLLSFPYCNLSGNPITCCEKKIPELLCIWYHSSQRLEAWMTHLECSEYDAVHGIVCGWTDRHNGINLSPMVMIWAIVICQNWGISFSCIVCVTYSYIESLKTRFSLYSPAVNCDTQINVLIRDLSALAIHWCKRCQPIL